MSAPKNNEFWKLRSSHGRNPIFSDPEDLWDASCEYFQWVEDNPLQEEKLFAYQGDITRATISKMRAMTLDGLCLFLDIGLKTFSDYREKEGFSRVIMRVENIIRSQKFAGAAADLLNANIIARDLGLKDNVRQELMGKDGGPIEHEHSLDGSLEWLEGKFANLEDDSDRA